VGKNGARRNVTSLERGNRISCRAFRGGGRGGEAFSVGLYLGTIHTGLLSNGGAPTRRAGGRSGLWNRHRRVRFRQQCRTPLALSHPNGQTGGGGTASLPRSWAASLARVPKGQRRQRTPARSLARHNELRSSAPRDSQSIALYLRTRKKGGVTVETRRRRGARSADGAEAPGYASGLFLRNVVSRLSVRNTGAAAIGSLWTHSLGRSGGADEWCQRRPARIIFRATFVVGPEGQGFHSARPRRSRLKYVDAPTDISARRPPAFSDLTSSPPRTPDWDELAPRAVVACCPNTRLPNPPGPGTDWSRIQSSKGDSVRSGVVSVSRSGTVRRHPTTSSATELKAEAGARLSGNEAGVRGGGGSPRMDYQHPPHGAFPRQRQAGTKLAGAQTTLAVNPRSASLFLRRSTAPA